MAFTRENWLRVLLQHKEIIKTAVKYKALKLFNPGDWRTLLCEDFDFFYPIAEEYGALQKFYEADWYMLIGNSYKNIPICATYFVALFT